MLESNNEHVESKAVTIIDSMIFFAIISVLACRLFVNESLVNALPALGDLGAGQMIIGFGGASFIFTLNMILLFVSALWSAVRFWQGSFAWRTTRLVLPVLLLLLATIVSVANASNKYHAFITSLTLLSSFSAGIILVQLLSCPWRRNLLLAVIIALGCSLALRCYQQKNEESRYNLQAMQDDYDGFMKANGYEPDSWQARQFEERVRSMDTGGYFSISNTAGSYLILTSFSSIALLAANIRNKKIAAFASLTFLVQFYGLWITESTGARLSVFAGLAFIALLFLLHKLLNRRALFILFVASLFVVPAFVWYYGTSHGRLPTSNLWIRWQYWQATAAMIAKHWLTGVGPANFGSSYLLYMNPFSPETVKDPHCVPLAILSQWGILGFVAMVWAALAVVYHLVVSGTSNDIDVNNANTKSPRQVLAWIVAFALSLVAAYYVSIDQTYGHSIFAVFLYIAGTRAFVFSAICIAVVLVSQKQKGSIGGGRNLIVVMLAGLAAFSLHNTIDFAFFAPAPCLMFFVVTAFAVSTRNITDSGNVAQWQVARFARPVAVFIILGSVFTWCYVGSKVYRSEKMKARAAHLLVEASKTQNLDMALQAAAFAGNSSLLNGFDPEGYYYAGKINYQAFQTTGSSNSALFQNAVNYVLMAKELDRANPSYTSNLGLYYYDRYLAGHLSVLEKQEALNLADRYFSEHLELYPGDSEVLVSLAQIKLVKGQAAQAKELAKKALDIEEGCMDLQPKLFPHREYFYHRLNEKDISTAQGIVSR